MKKVIIAATGVLFATTSLYAQKTSKPSITLANEISINAGIGSPSGDFAKGDYANETSGFAKAGFHINLSGTHYINKNWGINLLLGYTQFGQKGLQSLADGYKEDSGTDSTTLTTTEKSSSFSILVGPVYKIPVSDKFSIRVRVLGGYTSTTLGGFKVYYEDYVDNTVMSQKKSSGGGFGFQAGVGAAYNVTKNIAILLNADYFSSKPKISIGYENYNVNSGRKLSTYNESVSGLNATLGVSFSF